MTTPPTKRQQLQHAIKIARGHKTKCHGLKLKALAELRSARDIEDHAALELQRARQALVDLDNGAAPPAAK